MPSIRDIAERTGLSSATVSLALRDAGRIRTSTREKVKAAALELGYSPEPLLSKALSMVRQSKQERYVETLAFITEYSLDDPTLDPYPVYQEHIYAGAIQRARELGFKIEPFVLSGKPSEHRRLGRMLYARGVRGLIVIPRLCTNQPRLSFTWEHFAAVEIGRSLWHPRNMHHVETSQYNKVVEAIHLLKKVGYRRIGMAVEPNQNKHQRGVFYAAYLLSQMRIPLQKRMPIAGEAGGWNEKSFRMWMKSCRPDVLIVHDHVTVTRWLAKMKLSVPEDISLFCVNAQDGHLTGLRRDYRSMGMQAVELVSLMLQSNLLGLRKDARCWQVDECWQVGKTLSKSIRKFVSNEGILQTGPFSPDRNGA
jgi:DNA-binding LacI/PurR family transcriptional regulator